MSECYEYVVYLVTYSGTRHPKFYVGSTSKKQLANGYMGSVKSKKWRDVYNTELQDNPHLYTIEILSEHVTRDEAFTAELEYQHFHDVVKSPDFVNLSYAMKNGFMGRDVSGQNNPCYGLKRNAEWRQKISEANSGKIVASDDGSNTWKSISCEDFWKNRSDYVVPKVKFNQCVAEATRERVKNGTHHFCDPEVQAKIQAKRKLNNWKHSEETKAKFREVFKHRKISWQKKVRNYENFYALADVIFEEWNAGASTKEIIHKFNYLAIQKKQLRFFDRIVDRFQRGWNPVTDQDFQKWKDEYEGSKN